MNGIRAYLLTASQSQTLQAYPDGALAWDDQGTFCYAGPWSERPKKSPVAWEDLRHLIVTPGFIDVHCRLPQYPAVGIGGYPPLPWLESWSKGGSGTNISQRSSCIMEKQYETL